jgi:hypothetical protein
VRDGVPELVQGTVTPGFLQDVAEVCTRHGVRRGTIRGAAHGNRISLSFSGDMPASCKQQLRNIWNLSPRLSAAPNRRPPS